MKSDELRKMYAGLMDETRSRGDIILSAIKGRFGLPSLAAYELCYLQFRMICECIALGALAAHGDVPGVQSKRLEKAYSADMILNIMETLHPKFYPRPGEQVLRPDGKVGEVIPITTGFLTKPELLSLYAQCGKVLHRGPMRKLTLRRSGNFDEIENLLKKIVTLLSVHNITLINPKQQLWVIMKAKSDGRSHVSLMEAVDAPPINEMVLQRKLS